MKTFLRLSDDKKVSHLLKASPEIFSHASSNKKPQLGTPPAGKRISESHDAKGRG